MLVAFRGIMAATDGQGWRTESCTGRYVCSRVSSLRGWLGKIEIWFLGDSNYIRTELGLRAGFITLIAWAWNRGSAEGRKSVLIEGAGVVKLRLKRIAMAKHISACTLYISLRNTLCSHRRPCSSSWSPLPPLTFTEAILGKPTSRAFYHPLPILLLVLATAC